MLRPLNRFTILWPKIVLMNVAHLMNVNGNYKQVVPFPIHPSRSLSETFYKLKGSLGILPSSLHARDITFAEYKDTHFIIGVDLEKIGGDANYSGFNTKAGDLCIIKINWDSSIPQAYLPHKMFVVMTSDYMLEIKDNGCQLFD